MENNSRRSYTPLLILLTLGLYVFGQQWHWSTARDSAPQVVATATALVPPVARVRKHEYENGKAITEYDLGRFRCFELSGGEARFACAAH